MSKELKAIGILEKLAIKKTYASQKEKDEARAFYREAIKELEEYEQNFNQKEFEYRTNCQNLVSAGRVEAHNMPDRLAELEKVILDYYLAKGYEVGVGNWGFIVEIKSLHKQKYLKVSEKNGILVYQGYKDTTKDMFDKAIEYFSTRQNEVIECNQTKN